MTLLERTVTEECTDSISWIKLWTRHPTLW